MSALLWLYVKRAWTDVRIAQLRRRVRRIDERLVQLDAQEAGR